MVMYEYNIFTDLVPIWYYNLSCTNTILFVTEFVQLEYCLKINTNKFYFQKLPSQKFNVVLNSVFNPLTTVRDPPRILYNETLILPNLRLLYSYLK